MKKGDVCIHTKTGNKYVIKEFSEVKILGEWLTAVIYEKKENKSQATYVRTLDDFEEKFHLYKNLDLDDKIDAWHKDTETKLELHEYLGFTRDEFAELVKGMREF
jgi:iron uptake system EfeUOB component EfeO/EfeM